MNCAVLVAAGKGTRMGGPVDKLFMKVAGRAIVGHAWKRMDAVADIDAVILVVRGGREAEFEALAAQLDLTKPYRLVPGGLERQDSVAQGLAALPAEAALVAIQDGARPCTPPALVTEVLAAARQHGAAVAARRVTDTIKESRDGLTVARHLDRSRLWAVQTPQCFQLPIIRRALEEVRVRGLQVTDDTAACELVGQPVRLVECQAPNPKLTGPADLPYLELLLSPGLAGGTAGP